MTPTIPLYDRNGLYVRQIGRREAAAMIKNETAEPIQERGWKNRPDLELQGIRLRVSRGYMWSPSCIGPHEMNLVIGAVGSQGEQEAARLKLELWRTIH
jgi:hypothetical protein